MFSAVQYRNIKIKKQKKGDKDNKGSWDWKVFLMVIKLKGNY